MVFRKDVEIDLSSEVDYLEDDATGGDLTLDQLTRSAIGETLEAGRYGLLTDYPAAPEGATKAEVDALGLRANILPYNAVNIINWRSEVIGGVLKLVLVVLTEDTETVEPDGFETVDTKQYRALRLIDGLYVQEVYNEKGELQTSFEPKMSNGARWDIIPFQFIGSQNNDPHPDKAPLLDIADINIAHYRNSADFEESSYQVGQPTPVATGLNQSAIDAAGKNGLILGSRTAWTLNEGADAKLLQADPNQMPMEGMREKEIQLVKIGARIIMDNTGNETAEAAKMRHGASNSVLGTIVGNVESAIIQSIEWAMVFMGGSGEIKFNINRDFYDATVDPQLLIAQIQMLDRGIFAKKDLRSNMRRAGLIEEERTDEDLDSESEQADPLA
jgi:hypothetical protein